MRDLTQSRGGGQKDFLMSGLLAEMQWMGKRGEAEQGWGEGVWQRRLRQSQRGLGGARAQAIVGTLNFTQQHRACPSAHTPLCPFHKSGYTEGQKRLCSSWGRTSITN